MLFGKSVTDRHMISYLDFPSIKICTSRVTDNQDVAIAKSSSALLPCVLQGRKENATRFSDLIYLQLRNQCVAMWYCLPVD